MSETLAGGTASFVARARLADGRDAVLKVFPPRQDDAVAAQIATLRAADGIGYVRILDYDAGRRAVLLEALGPALSQLTLPPEQVIDLLAATLRSAWRAPRPAGIRPDAQDKATALRKFVLRTCEELGRPAPERVVRAAIGCADRRAAAFSLQTCVVVHGDPHPANALAVPVPRSGAESGYVFVDPDGFLAEPAYDLGVVLRDWCPQLLAAADPRALAAAYRARIAAATGVPAGPIQEWAFLERVSTGLHLLELGDAEQAEPFLASADALCRT